MVIPNNHGVFLLKMIILGCLEVPPFKETPISWYHSNPPCQVSMDLISPQNSPRRCLPCIRRGWRDQSKLGNRDWRDKLEDDQHGPKISGSKKIVHDVFYAFFEGSLILNHYIHKFVEGLLGE